MRYLLYARVSPKGSSWDGGETTCADQLRQCREFIQARDRAATFTEVIDELRSGGNLDRPGISRVLADLRAGRATWDCLVVRHLDRLTRSLADAMPLLRDLQDQGKSLICITQNLDLSGPAGRAMLHMLLVFAQFEREMGSERTKSKMMSIARAGGWPPGNPPLGYIRAGKKNNILAVDPVKSVIVRDLFRSYAAGTSVKALAHRHHWPISTVDAALRNPCYIGKIRYAGQTFQGKHQPIVTAEEWGAVRARMPSATAQGAPRRGAHRYPYLLPGLVKCHCGRTMTTSCSRGRHGGLYPYYQCTDAACKNRVSAAELDRHVLDTLASFQAEPGAIDAILAEIEKDHAERAGRPDDEARQVRAAQADAKKRIGNLTTALATGLVTAENAPVINQELARLTTETERLDQELTRIASQAEFDATRFAMAADAVRALSTLGELIARHQAANDHAALVNLVLTQVEQVKNTAPNTAEFEIIPSFAPGFVQDTGWRPSPELREPFLLHIGRGYREKINPPTQGGPAGMMSVELATATARDRDARSTGRGTAGSPR